MWNGCRTEIPGERRFRMRRAGSFVAGAVLAALAFPAAADPIFIGLGFLDGDFSRRSEAAAISADGTTVVGTAGSSPVAGVVGTSFRWTFETGIVDLGTLGGDTPRSRPLGVSADGSTVVGFSTTPTSQGEAYKWTLSNAATGAGSMVGLGDLPGGPFSPRPGPIDRNFRSQATAISDDGSVILGSGTDDTGTKGASFNGGPSDLGIGDVVPQAISGDGRSFVSTTANDAFDGRAEATLFSGGAQFLGVLPGELASSQALDISQDGSTVVGLSSRRAAGTGAIEREAFRWTAETGMVGLGDLPGGDFDSRAFAASGDGSIVVGESETSGGATRAFIWDESNGMRDLKQALRDDFGLGTPGFTRLNEAVGISADGRVITGTGINFSNRLEAWVAILDPLTPESNEFIWAGACGTSFWHDTCQLNGETVTNWRDPDDVPTISTPGSADPGVDVVRIDNAAVTLQQQPADIQSIQATGSLAVQAALSIAEDSSVQRLTVNSDLTTDGALNLNSQKEFLDPFTDQWLGGTISGDAANVAAGSSRLVVGPQAILEISGGDKTLNTNLIVEGGGQVVQLDGQLSIGNGAHLETEANAGYQIVAGGIDSGEAIVNAGRFAKVTDENGEGSEQVTIDADVVNNGGRIETEIGRLTFTGRNTHNGGEYRAGDGATLELLDGVTEVTGSLDASGAGNLELNGGSYTVKPGAEATFDFNGDVGVLLNNVLLDAQGRLPNQGRITFREGTIAGGTVDNGNVTGGVENAAGGRFQIQEQGGSKTLQDVLQNAGTIEHQRNADLLVDGGRIINQTGGEYTLARRSRISGGGAFDNAGGTLRVNAPGVIFEGPRISADFNMSNGGQLIVEEGFLELQGAGNHQGAGVFDTRDRAGDLVNTGGLSFVGDQTFNGDFRITGTGATNIVNAFNIQSGTVTADMIGPTGNVRMSIGEAATGNPSINATGGTFVNKSQLFFSRGSLTGGVATDSGSINGFENQGGTVSITTFNNRFVKIADGVLRNVGASSGAGLIEQEGDLDVVNGFILNDAGGVYEFRVGEIGRAANPDTSGAFRNRGGTLKKTGGDNADIRVGFEMSGGEVQVEAGMLSYTGAVGHTGAGQYTISEGASLKFQHNGENIFRGDYRIDGQGTAELVSGRDLKTEGNLVIDLTGPGKFVFDGSTIGGFGDTGIALINQGNAEWKGGTFGLFKNDGGHIDVVAGGLNKKQIFDAFENTGTVAHAADATVTFNSSKSRLINAGTYNLHGNLAGEPATQGVIENRSDGVFKLAAENVVRTFRGDFDNAGTVEVAEGSTLNLRGDVAQFGRNLLLDFELDGGTWIAHDRALIRLEENVDRVVASSGNVIMHGTGRLAAIPDASNATNQDFTNNGLFSLNQNAVFDTSADFVNNATLTIDSTSTLNVNGQFESNDGALNIINGMLTTTDLDVDGGSFAGVGTINAQTFNNFGALVGPGASPGILEVTGDYNQFVDGLLEIEIAGTTLGSEYDQLQVGGTATFAAGTGILIQLLDPLDFDSIANPFLPAVGDIFDIVVAETIVVPDPTDLIDLFDFSGLPGGLVFAPMLMDWEGEMDVLRLLVEAAPTAVADVPEPPSAMLLFVALAGVACARRQVRRRRRR